MSADTKIIERIQKLLRLARDKGATEAEAATALEAVNKLLLEHNLDMARVEGHTVSDITSDKSKRSGKNMKYECYVWKGASELNLCRYIGDSRQGDFVHMVIGTKVNVLAATLLAEYLIETINKMALSWGKTGEAAMATLVDKVSLPMAKHKYKQGMAAKIHNRCLEVRDSRLQGKGNALVLYADHAKALVAYIEKEVGETTERPTKIKGSSAMAMGRRDGDKVNLSQQVEAGPSKTARIGN